MRAPGSGDAGISLCCVGQPDASSIVDWALAVPAPCLWPFACLTMSPARTLAAEHSQIRAEGTSAGAGEICQQGPWSSSSNCSLRPVNSRRWNLRPVSCRDIAEAWELSGRPQNAPGGETAHALRALPTPREAACSRPTMYLSCDYTDCHKPLSSRLKHSENPSGTSRARASQAFLSLRPPPLLLLSAPATQQPLPHYGCCRMHATLMLKPCRPLRVTLRPSLS